MKKCSTKTWWSLLPGGDAPPKLQSMNKSREIEVHWVHRFSHTTHQSLFKQGNMVDNLRRWWNPTLDRWSIWIHIHFFGVILCRPKKIQIKHLNSLSSSVALALWPCHQWLVQKEIWRPFSTWELSGEFSVGIWVPEATNRKLFNLQKQDKQAKFVWTWAKTGVVFWKMRKPVEIGFS